MSSIRLKVIAIVTYLLLALLAIYFKQIPTIINTTISNSFIFMLVFALTLLLVYGTFLIKKTNDIYFLLPQSLIFTFIARAVPNLRLSYPPLHDPYFHFVSTLNVIEYGTLRPILGWWYSGIDTQLHWPDMHLITTALVEITNIDVMQFFRFQEPFLGIIFFMAVFLLTKTVTNNISVALLAGLFASINDIIIFYQSEYHPQGISIIYFVLLLYAFLKSRQVIDIRYRYISLIFGAVFITSHYFTPLFLALIFSSYIAVMLMARIFCFSNAIWDKYGNMFEDVRLDYAYFLIVIIASLSYHFFVYYGPLKTFIEMASGPALETHLISIGQTNVPLLTSILTSSKWGLFVLAIISILMIIKTKNTNEFRLGVITVCIVFAGFFGNYVIASPLDRIIGFYVPFAAIFASLTLYRFKDIWFRGVQKNRKVVVAVLIASIIMTAGFFNSQTPAYFFKDSCVDTYYWYSNRLPSMDEYKVVAEWVNKATHYMPYITKYGVEFDNRATLFYFGKIVYDDVIFRYYHFPDYSNDYILINTEIPYENEHGNKILNKSDIYKNINKIYTNSEVIIYLNNRKMETIK